MAAFDKTKNISTELPRDKVSFIECSATIKTEPIELPCDKVIFTSFSDTVVKTEATSTELSCDKINFTGFPHSDSFLLSSEEQINSNICGLCKKNFIIRSDLLSHICNGITEINSDHNDASVSHDKLTNDKCRKKACHCRSQKERLCPVCKKSVINFEKHMKTHSLEDNTFACETCGKTYKTMDTLTVHVRSYCNKKYFCPICNRGFRKKDFLNRHLLFHAKGKTLVCHICNKSFSSPNYLKVHLMKHTGISIL